jgi:dihydrofolate reductase
MRKLVLLMHVSLDGYVAGPTGEMDWIRVDEELFDYTKQQTDLADAALYGRVTYEMMDSYWPGAADKPGASKHDIEHSRWYQNAQKFVASRTKTNAGSNTTFIAEELTDTIAELKQSEGKHILLIGSPSIARILIQAGQIDIYQLFINPMLLGRGIRLFPELNERIGLELKESRQFANGVCGQCYVKREINN